VQAANNVTPFFVVSFCRHEEGTPAFEHGLLSQWRGYADTGGFAIEFDEEKLDRLLNAETQEFAYAGTKSADVRYDKFEEVFDPDTYKGLAGTMIWEVFNHAGIDVSAVTGRKNIDKVMLAYVQGAPFFKHWGFSEEREYRIVAVCIRPRKIAEGETRSPKWITFRQRNGLIVPYIELFERSNQPFPIKSIIIGPHPDQDKQAEAVAMALESEELEAAIRISGIPYRKYVSAVRFALTHGSPVRDPASALRDVRLYYGTSSARCLAIRTQQRPRYAHLASDPLRAAKDAVGAKITAALRIGSTGERSVVASKAS